MVISWDVEEKESLERWYNTLDKIKKLRVPFTLYIRLSSLLTIEQVSMLKEFEQNGHEIGYHTRFHSDAIKYILIEGHSIEEYVNYEIIPGIKDFRNNGIIIKNFAYPVAHHFTELDNYLLKHYFDSLRSVSPTIDWCYYKYNDNRVISAYWIDDLEIVPEESLLEDVYKALRKAKQEKYVLNLYGHNIGTTQEGYSTSFDKLQKIIRYARDLELEFYRMKDLFH